MPAEKKQQRLKGLDRIKRRVRLSLLQTGRTFEVDCSTYATLMALAQTAAGVHLPLHHDGRPMPIFDRITTKLAVKKEPLQGNERHVRRITSPNLLAL